MKPGDRVRIVDKGQLSGQLGTVKSVGRKVEVLADNGMVCDCYDAQLQPMAPMDEPLRRLAAAAAMNSFVEDVPCKKPVKDRTAKERRLAAKIASLTPKQQELLVALLRGEAALIQVNSESYAVRKTDVGHAVCSTSPGEPEHNVVDGKCSCEDARFRGNTECKHILALRKVIL